MFTYLAGYFLIVLLTSVVTVAAYGWDKRRAVMGGRRVPELRLHLLALVGGWPGALLGRRIFRHKTQKLSFRVVSALVLALHLALVAGAFYWLTPA